VLHMVSREVYDCVDRMQDAVAAERGHPTAGRTV
jgi:hypothetical protein